MFPFFVISNSMSSVKDIENRVIQVSKNVIVDIPDRNTKYGSMYVYMGKDPQGYLYHAGTAKEIFTEMLIDDNIEQIDELMDIILSFDTSLSIGTH